MRELAIGNVVVSDESVPYLIADISHNHLGSVSLAKAMITCAADAGVSGVKFQRRGKATYDGLRAAGEVAYAELREERELSYCDYKELKAVAHGAGVHFLATAFDEESVDLLESVGVDALKLASGDVTNTPLLEYAAGVGVPLLVSTGGCDMADVCEAHAVLSKAGAAFSLLHCTSEYPAKPDNANLRVIETYRAAFPETVIGFSSHVARGHVGAEAAAYALGARVFEKHFTLMPAIGTGEHAFGETPSTLAVLVGTLSSLTRALGDGVKRVLPAEAAGVLRLGKHLVYGRTMVEGERLEAGDLAVLGGGNGVKPNRLPALVGCRLSRDVEAGADVQAGDVEAVCQV